MFQRSTVMYEPTTTIEWGPAHLRDEAEFDEIPEDN